jgi:hypothetical protein
MGRIGVKGRRPQDFVGYFLIRARQLTSQAKRKGITPRQLLFKGRGAYGSAPFGFPA